MATATLTREYTPATPARAGVIERVRDMPPTTRLYWMLRVGVALEFIGHGLAGLAQSKAWFPYYALFGISKGAATHYWFYVTGTIDITLAVTVLVRPMRAVLLHMTFWGFMTAVLRPVVGESFFELVERGANYGMPLAFVMLVGLGTGRGTWSWRDLFAKAEAPEALDARQVDALAWVVRISLALLLVGHGGLGIWAHKPEWLDFFGFFGISQATVASAHLSQYVGLFEIGLGLAVLVKPVRELIVFVLVWKLGTEFLRPLVGQPMFQFIERSGDYVLPVGFLLLAGLRGTLAHTAGSRTPADPMSAQTWLRPAQPTGRPYPQQWHAPVDRDSVSAAV